MAHFLEFVFDNVENIIGYQHFLVYQQCFSNVPSPMAQSVALQTREQEVAGSIN